MWAIFVPTMTSVFASTPSITLIVLYVKHFRTHWLWKEVQFVKPNSILPSVTAHWARSALHSFNFFFYFPQDFQILPAFRVTKEAHRWFYVSHTDIMVLWEKIYAHLHIYRETLWKWLIMTSKRQGKIAVHAFLCLKFSVAFLLNDVPLLST